MNDPELVEVGHTGRDFRELMDIDEKKSRGTAGERTSRKRFASGLDFAYCITFPFGIHSVRMRKQRESADTETPNKGMTFGWDTCFQPIISRHNRWAKVERLGHGMDEVNQAHLENRVRIALVRLEMFDGHGGPRVFSIAHVCGPTMIADLPDAYELPLKNIGGGYDAVGFADLREKQSPSLPEFVVEG